VIVREPVGIETPLPGKSSERTWSKRREPDIRNAEGEGSSPFTSTRQKGQVTGLKCDPHRFTNRRWTATWLCVEVVQASWSRYRPAHERWTDRVRRLASRQARVSGHLGAAASIDS
jgi:hypothetical protein